MILNKFTVHIRLQTDYSKNSTPESNAADIAVSGSQWKTTITQVRSIFYFHLSHCNECVITCDKVILFTSLLACLYLQLRPGLR